MRDGPARAADDARGLSVRDFGDEGPEEAVIELGFLQAVVDTKRLRGEGAAALAAEETLDGAPVAGTDEAALEAPAVMARGARGTIGSRTGSRLKAHGSPFSRPWPGLRSLGGPTGLRAFAGSSQKTSRRILDSCTANRARFPRRPRIRPPTGGAAAPP